MLKILIILLCVFFFLRIMARMFLVSTFTNLNKKVSDEMNRRQGNALPNQPEGHVTIDPNTKNKKNDDGDYAEYEEIK